MQVKDVLKAKKRDIITARPTTSVPEAMALLIDNQISCLPVIDESDGLVGIISDKDIFRKVHSDPQGFQKSVVRQVVNRLAVPLRLRRASA